MSNRDVLQDIATTLDCQDRLGERGPFIARLDVVATDTGALTRKHFLIIDRRTPVRASHVVALIAFTLPDTHTSDRFHRGPISVIEANARGECFEATAAYLPHELRPVPDADPLTIKASQYTIDDMLGYARDLRRICGDDAALLAVANLAWAGLIDWTEVRGDILKKIAQEPNLQLSPDYPPNFAAEVDLLLTEEITDTAPHRHALTTILEALMPEDL